MPGGRKKYDNTQLQLAFDSGQLELFYQPQYDFLTLAYSAVEALIRWNHPDDGILNPSDFMPLAEETGLIIPIGKWVIEEACKQNRAWQDAKLPFVRVAVNITNQQLQHEDIVEVVQQALTQSGLHPSWLELEIVEDVFLDDQHTIEKIHQLKNLGIHIALDDFGAGCANLSHLKILPVDRVKIDRAYITNVPEDLAGQAHIREIITIAIKLNIRVLVEGVENEYQKQFLLQEKCHEAQGYYFSHPLPHYEFAELLRRLK